MSSSPAPSSVSPGQKFGKYIIKRLMAEGGMATVYEAVHGKLGHRVAIKLLARHLLEKPDVVERFEREARASARLESPHVVKIIDVDVAEDGRPYIVMEYLEGRDLETELRSRGRLPWSDAVAYILEAAAAVAVAHRAGVIHRDLKPANIFLAQEGARRVVKVLDFGISKVTSANEVSATSTQTMLGTPLYMSPEQVRSARDVDGRADIWSLGVVLYETITGQLPFMAEDASGVIAAIVSDPVVPVAQLRPDIPPMLAGIVMKALEKDRNLRFRLVEEMAAALMQFAPAWFRPPKMATQPPFMPGLPPHLAHSLADGIDSDRTVADPNVAADAFRPGMPTPPPPPPSHSGPGLAPMPAPYGFHATQTPDPSQPSAVTRTTAGGGMRPGAVSSQTKVVVAVAIGAMVGVIAFVAALLLRSHAEAAPPEAPTAPQSAPSEPTPSVIPTAPPPSVSALTVLPTVAVSSTASGTHHLRPHATGKLDVSVTGAWCNVAVDGAPAGPTPLADYDVPTGSHVVTCANASNVVRKQTIEVAAGEITRVKF